MSTPDDLITLSVASKVSERSIPTLRRWMRAEKLTRYEDKEHSGRGSAPVLVSRSELLSLLVSVAQQPVSQDDRPDVEQVSMNTKEDDQIPIQSQPVQVEHLPAHLDQSHRIALLTMEMEANKREAALKAELREAVLQAELIQARVSGDLQTARVELAEVRKQLHTARSDLDTARLETSEWKDRYDKAAAELETVRRLTRLPWWRRLLTTTEG